MYNLQVRKKHLKNEQDIYEIYLLKEATTK